MTENFNQDRKYHTSSIECYEPDSNNEVLKNLLGIKTRAEIEEIETISLKNAEEQFINKFTETHTFSSKDICWMHKQWLHDIYSFAGKYRNVNLTKDGFPFAAAYVIPAQMKAFEKNYLKKLTPCHEDNNLETLAEKIAIIHVEFILIHPFREGNGRLGRSLTNLLALQAGFPPLNFSEIISDNNTGYEQYIRAIHKGAAKDYTPMKNIFIKALEND